MEVSKPPPLRGAPLMGRHPPQILPLREDFSEGLVLLELYANKKSQTMWRKYNYDYARTKIVKYPEVGCYS